MSEEFDFMGVGSQDQMKAALRDMSKSLRLFYEQLRCAGFGSEQAMALVEIWFGHVLSRSPR